MEPPAKRIRLTKPPHHDPDDDYREEDDDESFDSSSEKGSIRDRSDGWEDGFDEDEDAGSQEAHDEPDDDDLLAQERAKLDNRFQQAMAGIFSKYGRDFEGIGDEVDLETGDVIVDNGHLKNMRYENDVGVDEDLEEGGVRLEDLDDGDDDEDEGMALADIPNDWDQDCTANGERGEAGIEGASLLQPVTSKNNPFMGFIARQPSPYTTAVFAPAETVPEDSEAAGGKEKGPEATELQSSASKPKPASPAAQKAHTFGSYDGQDSIWAPGPRFKDHWPTAAKSQAATNIHTRNTDSGVLEDRSLNDSQKQLPNFQGGKPKELMQANSWGTDDDLSTYLVLGEPDGMPENAPAAIHPRNSAEKEQRRAKSPESALPRQYHVQAEGSGDLGNLEEDVSASVDESAASRRRSGRARKKVDFLGLTSWDEALQDDVSSQLVLESRNEENRAVDDINDDQGLPTPPESGHDTSDSEQPNAPKSSKNETVPDSQETSTSRRSSPPPHQTAADKNANHAFGHSMHDLSDDESPVVFTKSHSPIVKSPGGPTRRTKDARAPSNELETTTVQYTMAETTAALSDDESPVVFKTTKPNIRKKQDQLPEIIENEPHTVTEEPDPAPTAVASKVVYEESGQDSSQQLPTSVQTYQGEQDAPSHEENSIVQPSEIADVPMADADAASLPLENETEFHTEPAARPENLESEELLRVPEEKENELRPLENSDEPVPEQTPTEVPRKPPPITDEAPSGTEVIPTEVATREASDTLQEHQEPTVPTESPEKVLSCKKSSQTIADSQEESTEGPQSSAQGPSSSSCSLPVSDDDTRQAPETAQSPKPTTSSQPKQPSRDPTPSKSQSEGEEASTITSSLPSRPLRSSSRRSKTQREASKETSSPLKRPSTKSTPSKTRSERRGSTKTSSPLKQPSPNPTPSKPQTERQSSAKPPKSRRSILTLIQDDDDDELLGNEADAVTLPKLLGTPSKRSRVWKTSARTTEQFRTPTKKKDKEVFSPGSVVRTPGGSKKICGVDGFRCERDFCFSCLS